MEREESQEKRGHKNVIRSVEVGNVCVCEERQRETERVCARRSGLGFCRCLVGWSMFYN